MRSCLTMKPEEEYEKPKKLLKDKYGQDYKIAAAYVDRINQAEFIKSEDGVALQKYFTCILFYLQVVEMP